jgi:hypothetical protein
MCDLKKNESSSSNDEDDHHHNLLNAISENQQHKNEEHNNNNMIENNEIKIDNSDVYSDSMYFIISLITNKFISIKRNHMKLNLK